MASVSSQPQVKLSLVRSISVKIRVLSETPKTEKKINLLNLKALFWPQQLEEWIEDRR
jgi:hypothetical protein